MSAKSTFALRENARRRGVHVGTAVSAQDLEDPAYTRALRRDCTLITAEYEMKWDALVPDRSGRSAADAIVTFAEENGLAVHGHALWWHGSVPKTLSEVEPGRFRAAALRHVAEAAGRYAGRLLSWDVVNEPLDLAHGRPDGLRPSPFLDALGPDYVGTAYRAAAEADPGAILVLNEMGLEDGSPDAERKRRAMVGLLERELGAGTPIQCLGLQSHLDATRQPRDNPGLRAFLREVRGLGLPVMITELDVADQDCPSDLRTRDRMVADVYRAYLDLVLEEARVLAVTTWGLSDARTWLSGFRPRPDGAPVRPLPRDAAFRRKRAWHALAGALVRVPLCKER